MTGQTGIFISHAHADQEIADVIRKKLRRFFANGVPIFLSPNTIAAGKSWLPEIEKALKCRGWPERRGRSRAARPDSDARPDGQRRL